MRRRNSGGQWYAARNGCQLRQWGRLPRFPANGKRSLMELGIPTAALLFLSSAVPDPSTSNSNNSSNSSNSSNNNNSSSINDSHCGRDVVERPQHVDDHGGVQAFDWPFTIDGNGAAPCDWLPYPAPTLPLLQSLLQYRCVPVLLGQDSLLRELAEMRIVEFISGGWCEEVDHTLRCQRNSLGTKWHLVKRLPWFWTCLHVLYKTFHLASAQLTCALDFLFF